MRARFSLRLFYSAGLNGFFGEDGLLAETIGDFGDVAVVDANCWEIVGLADEIQGAQGFPDLLGTGIDGSYFRAGCYCSAGDDR